MPLTPEEKNHCDHLDFENTHGGSTELVETPAIHWNRASGHPVIENILTLRRWERKDVMLPEKPEAPFAPAWSTADEAKARNAELASEVEALKEQNMGNHLTSEERNFILGYWYEINEGPGLAHAWLESLGMGGAELSKLEKVLNDELGYISHPPGLFTRPSRFVEAHENEVLAATRMVIGGASRGSRAHRPLSPRSRFRVVARFKAATSSEDGREGAAVSRRDAMDRAVFSIA